MAFITAVEAGGENLCAFLDTIAWSEIGPRLLAKSDNGYNVLVGSTPSRPLLFDSYASHPDVYNRHYNSTAAGRYQLLSRYYAPYKTLLGLHDFSPLSQDKIALQQIKECRAIPLIANGHFASACSLVAHIWASFPGADYGQHENEIKALEAAYVKAGGVLA